jgi:hypothetical protein
MKFGRWDYDDPVLIVNRIKLELETADLMSMTSSEGSMWREMLWLWHHHAISCAIWKKLDKPRSQFYAKEAVSYMGGEVTNDTTRVLFYLVHDQLSAAEAVAKEIGGGENKVTANLYLTEYKEGKFYKPRA